MNSSWEVRCFMSYSLHPAAHPAVVTVWYEAFAGSHTEKPSGSFMSVHMKWDLPLKVKQGWLRRVRTSNDDSRHLHRVFTSPPPRPPLPASRVPEWLMVAHCATHSPAVSCLIDGCVRPTDGRMCRGRAAWRGTDTSALALSGGSCERGKRRRQENQSRFQSANGSDVVSCCSLVRESNWLTCAGVGISGGKHEMKVTGDQVNVPPWGDVFPRKRFDGKNTAWRSRGGSAGHSARLHKLCYFALLGLDQHSGEDEIWWKGPINIPFEAAGLRHDTEKSEKKQESWFCESPRQVVQDGVCRRWRQSSAGPPPGHGLIPWCRQGCITACWHKFVELYSLLSGNKLLNNEHAAHTG